MTTILPLKDAPDSQLVSLCLQGDRDSFAAIVSRYQNLICSLAYSATGDVAQSEEFAQETFLAAWTQLRNLREPDKLRAWLCGILRNVANNSIRKASAAPARQALDDLQTSAEASPAEHAISHEEQAILWRTLKQIPEIYREPMVLFYRQEQSVKQVAEALEISEDALKQRLSRGRQLLREEMARFVEDGLRLSAPTRAFTLAVLASLPAFVSGAKAATISAAAAKGTVLAKSAGAAALFNFLLGPVLAIFGGFIGVRASLRGARTPRQREFIRRYIWYVNAAVILVNVLMAAYVQLAVKHARSAAVTFILVGLALPVSLLLFILVWTRKYNRGLRAIRDEEGDVQANDAPYFEWRSRATFLGIPLVHIRGGGRPGERYVPAVGWIAIGNRACGVLLGIGGIASGAIAFGGISLGIFAIGGAGFGLLSLAGFAVGALAIGGGAIGLVAFGGIAVGWTLASGGIAMAHQYAAAGVAVAPHANDAAAHAYLRLFRSFDVRHASVRNIAVIVLWLPVILLGMLWPVLKRRLSSHRSG